MGRFYGYCIVLLVLLGLIAPAPSHGREKVQLASSPALSVDGKLLAFAWHGDIWTVRSSGGLAKRLTSHPAADSSPIFSPDGRSLAFLSDRDGADQVYLLPISGGEARRLTYHSEGCRIEDWRSDGRSLLISASRDHFWRHAERFFQIDAEQRSAEQLLFDGYGSNGALSPDGSKLLFTREGTAWWRKGYRGAQSSQVWLYDIKSGEFKLLIREPSGARWPLWAADGRSFYYVGGQSGSFNLWHRQLKTAKQEQLTHFDDDSVVMPAISRDGTAIVFRHLFDLYRLQPDSDQAPKRISISVDSDLAEKTVQRRRLDRATEVAFSEDGLEVAFIAGGDLWVMDTELREPRQITDTPEEESEPVFTRDGKAILFTSDMQEQGDLWKAERSDAQSYWWQNEAFTLTRLTNDAAVEGNLQLSPDGDRLAFVRGRGDLVLIGLDGKGEQKILSSWSGPDYDWSPDGKWLVYSLYDSDFNRDIWIRPIDNSQPPFNLSRHPDNDYAPRWSPDGKKIAFTGRRRGTEVDIYYVYLTREEDETTSRDRKLDKAIEKIEKVRGKQEAKPAESNEKKADATADADEKADDEKDTKSEEQEKQQAEDAADKPKLPEVTIDFDGIHERIRRVSIQDTSEGRLFWSHDSAKLAFSATVAGRSGTYTISFPEDLKPKLLSTKTGSHARWISRGNQILWLADGLPGTLGADGKTASYSFAAYQELNLPEYFGAAFDQCWRTMRDSFYDEHLNNRNWDQIRRKYAQAARMVVDGDGLDEVVNLMLGELNGSHLGFTPRWPKRDTDDDQWSEATAHLGLRFDADYKGPGWKVRDVIPRSPADHAKSRIEAGEIVLKVDDRDVDPDLDVASLLNGRLDRDIQLRIKGKEAKERDVTLRPISYSMARTLLYEAWIRSNRAIVEKASKGNLGYLHIRAMDMSSFYRFEHELYDAAVGKDGLIIDVRENGGGSTTDHLLTALTQPTHAITVPRGGEPGYPQDRRVYATWNKPIAVLCNQNSFSNAEIFSHAIKTLGRGKLIGVPTSGSVISTGATSIMDVGTLRVPFRGWYLSSTGQDMELNGAVPHHVVWPKPCEWPSGIDRQLEKAVQVLQNDVKRWQKQPRPDLQQASQR